MITTITSGGHYERAVQFYFCSGSFATARWTRRLDPGRERSSVTATQACLELGGDPGGDGQALAQDGQKRRWWTRLALAGGLVCALGGLDGCQAARFASGGDGVLRHDCAGARHRLSERGWDYAWSGAARLSQPGESERERPGSGRGREREGKRALQDGQRVPSVCQDSRAERSTPASTRRAERGVDRAQPRGNQAGGPQRQESDPIGGQENGADDRGECHLAAADWALAADRSSGEGQDLTRGDHPGAGDGQKQGGQARGVWVEVAGQSHRRGVCVWASSRSGCGRAGHADRSDERLSAGFWGASRPGDEHLRPRGERAENDRGVESAGSNSLKQKQARRRESNEEKREEKRPQKDKRGRIHLSRIMRHALNRASDRKEKKQCDLTKNTRARQ